MNKVNKFRAVKVILACLRVTVAEGGQGKKNHEITVQKFSLHLSESTTDAGLQGSIHFLTKSH